MSGIRFILDTCSSYFMAANATGLANYSLLCTTLHVYKKITNKINGRQIHEESDDVV